MYVKLFIKILSTLSVHVRLRTFVYVCEILHYLIKYFPLLHVHIEVQDVILKKTYIRGNVVITVVIHRINYKL